MSLPSQSRLSCSFAVATVSPLPTSSHAVATNSAPPALTHHLDDEEGPKSPDHKQQKKDAAEGKSPGSQEAQHDLGV